MQYFCSVAVLGFLSPFRERPGRKFSFLACSVFSLFSLFVWRRLSPVAIFDVRIGFLRTEASAGAPISDRERPAAGPSPTPAGPLFPAPAAGPLSHRTPQARRSPPAPRAGSTLPTTALGPGLPGGAAFPPVGLPGIGPGIAGVAVAV